MAYYLLTVQVRVERGLLTAQVKVEQDTLTVQINLSEIYDKI